MFCLKFQRALFCQQLKTVLCGFLNKYAVGILLLFKVMSADHCFQVKWKIKCRQSDAVQNIIYNIS